MKYSKKVLANGLTIIEVPSNDAESVVVDFFVKAGSRSENASENGLSHFLEHFLFKGTKQYPTALAISEQVDAIGGEMNANTGKEHTQYFIKAASKHLALIFEILTDMIKNPLLDPAELAREKGVIVEEINMYKDTPTAEIENVLEGEMWPDEPLGRDIAGEKKTVTKFTRPMFADYIQRFYQTPNILLGISGKYNSEIFHRLVGKHWVAVPQRNFGSWHKAKDRQRKPRFKLQYKKTEQAHLTLGFKALPYTDPRNYALSVLAAVLGGGMSSRLFIEVRERRGLAYYVRAGSSNYQDTGVFTVGSGVKVAKIHAALRVIVSELKKMKQVAVTGRELHKAQEYIKGKTTLALEDNQVRLDWFLEHAAFHHKIITPKEAFGQINRVTPGQVRKLAREIFVPKNLTLAVIGPYRGGRRDFHSHLSV
ncbi:MAG: insulinase family protein [Candidatus Doudnabacteria bacterium]|nr:insulinase family protein [Candidatus Doudnabacteria bacterium]